MRWQSQSELELEKAFGFEEVDIDGLNAEIARIVAREHELRDVTDEIVADLEGRSK